MSNPNQPSRPSRALQPEDVNAAFRALAEEHAEDREADDRERAWRLIQIHAREDQDERRVPAFRYPVRTPLARVFGRFAVPAVAVAALAAAAFGARGLFSTPSENATLAASPSGAIHTEAASKNVDFGDGTRLIVAPHTSLSVEVLGAHASRTRLERGRLEVDLHPRSDSEYRFFIGPYEVQAQAARFEVSWDPVQENFSLLSHGDNVRVLGPDGLNRTVPSGQKLELSAAQSAVAGSSFDLQAPVVSVPGRLQGDSGRSAKNDPDRARIAARSERNEARNERGEQRNERSEVAAPEDLDFASLVAKGRFAEVVSAAESQGLEQVLREKSASELNALGHAANYTGRSQLAVQAWTALRKRFAAHRTARQAAFFLGRIQEQQGRLNEALGWLDTYLAEARKDSYVPEAAGRRLLLVQKLEGPLVAQKAAREYLERFPNGAYASNARALLSQP
ncbi:MAG TPA: tetratricopeptide repeat protein [Polyangiaceae bacterium]|nr:tetratricopeptide repeat protein [Polyangiaceae bacterium]